MSKLSVDFCGETLVVDPDRPFVIGRDGPDADLAVDENAYLHRRFLELARHDGLWWLSNVGTQLSATASDADGTLQAYLAPGARLPLVLPLTTVRFAAAGTSYELDLIVEDAPFAGRDEPLRQTGRVVGDTTLGRVDLTRDQKLLVLALAESSLRQPRGGRTELPSSVEAAARLGWPITKFNRKLDNVCQKLKRGGVRGLHGDADRLASGRRARLVEYALAVRLVTVADLPLLEEAADQAGTLS